MLSLALGHESEEQPEMEVLGHPLTYPTWCFIDGGCGARVYFHTNGNGDFVLFDALGQPWPIHSCYLDRLGEPVESDPRPEAPDAYTNQEWVQEVARRTLAYKEAARQASLDRHRPPMREIRKIEPASVHAPIQVCGYIQDIIEKHAAKLLRHVGTLGQQLAAKALGSRVTQLTLVTSEFASYTAFADLAHTVVGRGSTVVAVLQPTAIVGLGVVFVVCELDVVPIRPAIRPRSTKVRGGG